MKVLNKPIEAIAFNKENGEIIPFRFRVTMEDGERFAYDLKINSIYSLKEDISMFVKYTCQIEQNHQMQPCEIRYDIENKKWTLYKI